MNIGGPCPSCGGPAGHGGPCPSPVSLTRILEEVGPVNGADAAYKTLVQNCLTKGKFKPTTTYGRGRPGTISTFGEYYEVDLAEGFPILTTKKISWKNIVIELLWFLSGEKKLDLLKRHGCHFWDDWENDKGEVPSAYGNFWRRFPTHGEEFGYAPRSHEIMVQADHVDQLEWVQETLRENPYSRKMVVSAWYPGNAHHSSLAPCHSMFIFNVQPGHDGRDRLNCHLTQRSADIALGVPYNLASYALLTHLFARFAGLEPGIFAHTMVDAHIYTVRPGQVFCRPDGTAYSDKADHVPGLKEQIQRAPRYLPTLTIDSSIQRIEDLDDVRAVLRMETHRILQLFRLDGYDPHPPIKFEAAV